MNYNINQYNFAITGLATATNNLFTNHAIAGEVLSIDWSMNTTGSMFVVTSGTNQLLFSRIIPSGTVWQHAPIGEFIQISTGSITAASMRGYIANEPLIVAFSGANANSSGAVQIRYR